MKDESGFTLIELLVVVLIIAILAAIAIPVFLEQREKGYVAQSQDGLKGAATAIESFVTGGHSYAGVDGADSSLGNAAFQSLHDEGFRSSADLRIQVSATDTTYCITATNPQLRPGNDWRVSTYSSDTPAPKPADACA